MPKIFYYLFGFLAAFVFPIIGLGITKIIGHGFALGLFAFLPLVIGINVYKQNKHHNQKAFSLGLLLGAIPIIILTLFILIVSQLH